MKKLTFDEQLEALVDENGLKYEGRRFKTIDANYIIGCSSAMDAEIGVLRELKQLANSHKADAYEVIQLQFFDSRQEYDSKPYTAAASAILYKI